MNKVKNALYELMYVLRHPTDGFDTMKYKKSGSVWLSFVIVLLWFVASVAERQYTNFRFNPNNTNETNILFVFISTVVVFLFFVIANWSISTLFDGEGDFREIWVVTGYAIFPYVISVFVGTILSYFLTVDEGMFISFVTIIGLCYSLLLMVDGMMQIHRYSFGKVLIVLVVSVVGMFLILFLCFLVMILFQQLGSFITSVAEEIMMREMI